MSESLPGKNYQAVLFDMDGLLLDTEPLWRHAWQCAALEFGFTISDPLYLQIVGLNPGDTDAVLVEALGGQFPIKAARKRRNELWTQRVQREGIALKPGVHTMLARLQGLSIPWAIATSSDNWAADRCLRAAGIEQHFPLRATSDQVRCGKPEPDLYLKAAQLLGMDPTRCLALEDSDVGARAALRAGADTLIVPDLKPPSAGIRGAAVQVLDSLDQAADWLLRAN